MPRFSLRERSPTYTAITALNETPLLTLLYFCFFQASISYRQDVPSDRNRSHRTYELQASQVEPYFHSALAHLGPCRLRGSQKPLNLFFSSKKPGALHQHVQRRWLSKCAATKYPTETELTKAVTPPKKSEPASACYGSTIFSEAKHENWRRNETEGEDSFFKPFHEVVDHGTGSMEEDANSTSSQSKQWKAKLQAQLSALENQNAGDEPDRVAYEELNGLMDRVESKDTPAEAYQDDPSESTEEELVEQIRYLKTVRDLEKKLEKARHTLHLSIKRRDRRRNGTYWQEGAYHDQHRIEMMNHSKAELAPVSRPTVKLKKEDFLGLVDLYFYSHRSRFLSESPDASPTPLELDDYSFKLSEDFSPPTNPGCELVRDEEGTPVSPLYHVEAEIKTRKLNEIKALQNFVDLLLDDYSPLIHLFRAYKALPQPGVSYLSGGVIRLFLQRMSTPWRTSEKAMARYLSLLDDMQLAGLPITAWEWSSAIYLAGQSFNNVSNSDVTAAFGMWRQMEKDAGVPARAVTFNILFDIAIKAEKFVLAEEILREMHHRGFRLNRLGRVSLIYYYGKKGDGDGVRKAYRDFVEAGEIVDTLVLNCVMASLINAQEPAAAEQIYERMKGMQDRLQRGTGADGEEALFLRYPPPGPVKIGTEMASNALGRVLLNASRLKTILPLHHAELQNIMPLTPDAFTYRTLMRHHAKTSGNIDRLTVLLDDMTRRFGIPIKEVTFQLLFRGFAMHGGSHRSDAKWTQQRLQIAWAACLICMKAGKAKDSGTSQNSTRLDLPSSKEAETMAADDEKRAIEEASKRPKPRKPTAWDAFITQFLRPYPETKSFDLYSTSADASEPTSEDESCPGEEYRIPQVDLTPKQFTPRDKADINPIQPSRQLVVWAIRAFTRCTTSRSVVEDVWYQVARIWRPVDVKEKAEAIRELRRALGYCDTHGKKIDALRK
jgi:pentatricopeptide repeat protein